MTDNQIRLAAALVIVVATVIEIYTLKELDRYWSEERKRMWDAILDIQNAQKPKEAKETE